MVSLRFWLAGRVLGACQAHFLSLPIGRDAGPGECEVCVCSSWGRAVGEGLPVGATTVWEARRVPDGQGEGQRDAGSQQRVSAGPLRGEPVLTVCQGGSSTALSRGQSAFFFFFFFASNQVLSTRQIPIPLGHQRRVQGRDFYPV